MQIFVGSLPFKLKEEELRKLFEQFGQVSDVKIIIDNISRQNKGFGFVTMPDAEEATLAINELNESELLGRILKVSKAVSRETEKGEKRMTHAGKIRRNDKPQGGFSRDFKKKR